MHEEILKEIDQLINYFGNSYKDNYPIIQPINVVYMLENHVVPNMTHTLTYLGYNNSGYITPETIQERQLLYFETLYDRAGYNVKAKDIIVPSTVLDELHSEIAQGILNNVSIMVLMSTAMSNLGDDKYPTIKKYIGKNTSPEQNMEHQINFIALYGGKVSIRDINVRWNQWT